LTRQCSSKTPRSTSRRGLNPSPSKIAALQMTWEICQWAVLLEGPIRAHNVEFGYAMRFYLLDSLHCSVLTTGVTHLEASFGFGLVHGDHDHFGSRSCLHLGHAFRVSSGSNDSVSLSFRVSLHHSKAEAGIRTLLRRRWISYGTRTLGYLQKSGQLS